MQACLRGVYQSAAPSALMNAGGYGMVAYSMLTSARPAATSLLARGLTRHPAGIGAVVAAFMLGSSAMRVSERCDICYLLSMASEAPLGSVLRRAYRTTYAASPLLEAVEGLSASPTAYAERPALLAAALRQRQQLRERSSAGAAAPRNAGGPPELDDRRQQAWADGGEDADAAAREGDAPWAADDGSAGSRADNGSVGSRAGRMPGLRAPASSPSAPAPWEELPSDSAGGGFGNVDEGAWAQRPLDDDGGFAKDEGPWAEGGADPWAQGGADGTSGAKLGRNQASSRAQQQQAQQSESPWAADGEYAEQEEEEWAAAPETPKSGSQRRMLPSYEVRRLAREQRDARRER